MTEQGTSRSERPAVGGSGTSDGETDPRTPGFRALPRQHGVRVVDPVERVEFDVYTPDDVAPRPVDPDRAPVDWCFPIDSAAAVEGSRARMPVRMNVTVRRPDGSVVATSGGTGPLSVDEPGTYTVELTNTPMKLYLACHGRLAVFTEDVTEVVFRDADEWFVGARSLHEHPARTLTATTRPRDLMLAVSEFGAALKTTSVERSFPTLRGYPPLIERGDQLDIPGGVRSPETGIRLRVPPELSGIFTVAPLAYYLGATVEPAADGVPRLVTDEGFSYDLSESARGGFDATVGAVLRHVFTLDCLTRTHGYYPVETAAYERARETIGADGGSRPGSGSDPSIDFEWLYDQPIAAQVAEYLRLPFDAVADLQPAWRLHATVEPAPDRIGVLPHLAAELATVTCGPPEPAAGDAGQGAAASDGSGAPESTDAQLSALQDFLRADGADALSRSELVQLPDRDVLTQTYVGDGFPLGANKASRTSFERKLEVHSSLPRNLSATVVCNDPEMTNELRVGDFYTGRDTFEIGVDVHTETTRAELRELFRGEADLLHFVGHVTADGMQCSDGYLDAASLTDVSVPAFLLNGCQSCHQGELLVERGAVAGIVTVDDVLNGAASEIGRHLARLLNAGWPLDAAVEVIREESVVGTRYMVVGDGTVELVNSKMGVPTVAYLTPEYDDSDDNLTVREQIERPKEPSPENSRSILESDRYGVEVIAYPTRRNHLGTLMTPYIGEGDRRYLGSGQIDSFSVSSEELAGFLKTEAFPVLFPLDSLENPKSRLRWSNELNPI